MTLCNRLQDLLTGWRRWRLTRAYSAGFTAKTEKREATYWMRAYKRTGRDGIFSFSDREIIWNWHQDGGKA